MGSLNNALIYIGELVQGGISPGILFIDANTTLQEDAPHFGYDSTKKRLLLEDVNSNILIGSSAVASALTTGANNVSVGNNALENVTSGIQNVCVGYQAGQAITSGVNNVCIGYQSASAGGNFTGGNNVFVGYGTAVGATTGNFNTAVGENAGHALTSGTENVLLGSGSGQAINTGGGNVVIGYLSGPNISSGGNNTIVGLSAGGGIVTGGENVAIGTQAMSGVADISGNVGIGQQALTQDQTGQNVAVGYFAGNIISAGSGNIAVGYQAMGSAAAVAQNVSFNVCIGENAGAALASNAQGNVLIGKDVKGVSTGIDNVVIGNGAGSSIGTGSFNLLLGFGQNGYPVNVPANNTSNYLNICDVLKGDMAAGPLAFSIPISIASAQLAISTVALTNNAGAQIATITNGPIAGNPTKWVPINDNGTIRNIPAW